MLPLRLPLLLLLSCRRTGAPSTRRMELSAASPPPKAAEAVTLRRRDRRAGRVAGCFVTPAASAAASSSSSAPSRRSRCAATSSGTYTRWTSGASAVGTLTLRLSANEVVSRAAGLDSVMLAPASINACSCSAEGGTLSPTRTARITDSTTCRSCTELQGSSGTKRWVASSVVGAPTTPAPAATSRSSSSSPTL